MDDADNVAYTKPRTPSKIQSTKRYYSSMARPHSFHCLSNHKRLRMSDQHHTRPIASSSIATNNPVYADDVHATATTTNTSSPTNEQNNMLLRTLTEILTNQLMLTRKIDSIKANIDLINQRLTDIESGVNMNNGNFNNTSNSNNHTSASIVTVPSIGKNAKQADNSTKLHSPNEFSTDVNSKQHHIHTLNVEPRQSAHSYYTAHMSSGTSSTSTPANTSPRSTNQSQSNIHHNFQQLFATATHGSSVLNHHQSHHQSHQQQQQQASYDLELSPVGATSLIDHDDFVDQVRSPSPAYMHQSAYNQLHSLTNFIDCRSDYDHLVSRDVIKRCIRKAKHRGNFAANLAAELFTKDERISGNCTGTRGKRQLSPRRLEIVRDITFQMYSCQTNQEMEELWRRECITAIDAKNRSIGRDLPSANQANTANSNKTIQTASNNVDPVDNGTTPTIECKTE